MKKLAFILTTFILGAGITLGAAELGVRLLVPESVWRASISSLLWQPDAKLGWTQQPNLDLEVNTEQGRRRFRTNGDGLRPATATPVRTRDLRILLTGDSTVLALGVDEESALHRQLERALAARGVDAEVISGGVEGHSTDQVLLRTRDLLELYVPDIVIHSVCSNDFLALGRPITYGRPKPRFSVVGGELVLESPDLKVDPVEVPFMAGLAYKSALIGYLRPGLLRLRAFGNYWLKKHPERWSNEIYFDPVAREAMNLDLFARLLGEMAGNARGHGAAFFVYVHPDAISVWEPLLDDLVEQMGYSKDSFDPYAVERVVETIAEDAQLEFVPMIDSYRGHEESGPFHLLPRDPHSNAAGYRVIAQSLVRGLVDSGTVTPGPGR